MSRGEPARRIHLLDKDARELTGEFLPGQELWDPAGQRFTLTFDPGRIKRGLEANQKMGTTYSAADVAGPGLAGLLISALTATTALVFDAFSYLISLLTLLWIRTPEPAPKPAGEPRHLGRELVEGLRFVFGHKILRPLALVAPFCNFITRVLGRSQLYTSPAASTVIP